TSCHMNPRTATRGCIPSEESPVQTCWSESGARWGTMRYRRRTTPETNRSRGSRSAAPVISGMRLLVEAAPEAILHPAGERAAGPSGATLVRRIRAGHPGWPTPPDQPGAGDRENHAAEHDDESDD